MPSLARPSLISARRHRGAVVAHGGARQAALLHRLRQAVGDVLRALGQIPLQMAGQPRAVVEHAEQDRRSPFAARRQHLARTVMTIPVPQTVHVLGLVAAHLARIEPGRGGQRAGGLARRHRTTPGQAVGGQEPPDRRVGWHRPQLGPGLGQGDQIVVMQLRTPAFVGVILGQQGLAQRRGHRRLLTGVLAPLAAQHAHRVMPLIAGTVEPSLQRGDAEADRRAGARVPPFAGRQLLAAPRASAPFAGGAASNWPITEKRSRAQRSCTRDPPRSATPALRQNERADGKRPRRWPATSILCGSAAPVRKRASPMRRRSADRGTATRR